MLENIKTKIRISRSGPLQFILRFYNQAKGVYVFPVIFATLCVTDIFFVSEVYDSVHLLLFIYWVCLVVLLRYGFQVSLNLATICLILIPIFLSLGIKTTSEKLAIWALFMLWVGVIQMLGVINKIDSKIKPKKE